MQLRKSAIDANAQAKATQTRKRTMKTKRYYYVDSNGEEIEDDACEMEEPVVIALNSASEEECQDGSVSSSESEGSKSGMDNSDVSHTCSFILSTLTVCSDYFPAPTSDCA